MFRALMWTSFNLKMQKHFFRKSWDLIFIYCDTNNKLDKTHNFICIIENKAFEKSVKKEVSVVRKHQSNRKFEQLISDMAFEI